MSSRSDFYEKVYEIVGQIPSGKVTTYGAIVGHIGVRSGARMVGYALNNLLTGNSQGCNGDVPAHRVVNRLGCDSLPVERISRKPQLLPIFL